MKRTATRIATRVVAAICLATTLGCDLSNSEHRAVDAWLNCDECNHGERTVVKNLGERAIPRLAKALLEGPPADRRQIMRNSFESAWRSTDRGKTQAAYVDELIVNYVAGYQKRAAISLGDIGGIKARTVLRLAADSIVSRGLRSDVIHAVQLAGGSVAANSFTGVIRPSAAPFGDTIKLLAPVGQPFYTNANVTLDAPLFPADDIVIYRRPDSLAFLAVGAPGFHRLSVNHGGQMSAASVAAITISGLADANDRRMLSCSTSQCQVDSAPDIAPLLPYQTFVALWRTPPRVDTLDVFRLRTTFSRPIAARLEWKPASTNLDLRWVRCNALVPVGNTNGATTAAVETTSVVIPNNSCWALMVLLVSGDGPAFAKLAVTSR